MRRLARILVNLLTVTSVLLSLVVGWLWVRGYAWYDDLGIVTTWKTAAHRIDRHYALGSNVGGLTWQMTTYEWTTPNAVARARERAGHFWRNVLEAKPRPYFVVASDRFGGFNLSRDGSTAFDPDKIYSWRSVAVRTPMWFVLAVVASPATARCVALAVSMAKRRRRRKAGLCLGCGYDLRASTARCPECGAVPAPQATAPS
jgi:hypothetical protein